MSTGLPLGITQQAANGGGGIEPPAEVGTTRILDNFVDTNGTSLLAHTPDVDGSGNGYGEQSSTSTTAIINGNAAGVPSGYNRSMIDSLSTDTIQHAIFTIGGGGTGVTNGCGLMARIYNAGYAPPADILTFTPRQFILQNHDTANPFIQGYQNNSAVFGAAVTLTGEGPLTGQQVLFELVNDPNGAGQYVFKVTLENSNTYTKTINDTNDASLPDVGIQINPGSTISYYRCYTP